MPSLKSINAEAGTNFRRWKEVGPAIKEGEQAKAEVEVMKAKPEPEPDPEPISVEAMEKIILGEVAEPVPAPALDRDKVRVRATNSAGSDDWKEDTVDKPAPQHIIDSMPDFPPRITNPTERRQMQGAGFEDTGRIPRQVS